MPVAKTKDFKVENLSFDRTDFGETNDGKKFSKHFFRYRQDGSKGPVRFKGDFSLVFKNGLYFEQGDSKYRKLIGRATLDLSDEKTKNFADSPDRGVETGWVKVEDVKMKGFNSFEAKDNIPYYSESTGKDDDKKGEIPKGTILTSDQQDDEFFHVSFGGGKSGMLYLLRKAVAKQLYKNRKATGLDKIFKSEKELEKSIKFPLYFNTDDEGNVSDTASWFIKISYREGKDGFMAKFNVPGVRELTIDEMLNNSIAGRPCFSMTNVYQGGGKYSMQIFLSSLVVTNFAPIERASVQQEDIDELAADPEFVERMKSMIPEKPVLRKERKERKDQENIKDILAPTLKKVELDEDSEDESEDGDDEIQGVPEARAAPESEDDDDSEILPIVKKAEPKRKPVDYDDDDDDDTDSD